MARYRVRVGLVRERSVLLEAASVQGPEDVDRLVRASGVIPEGFGREIFGVLGLDNRNRCRGIHGVTVGTVNASLVRPADVFRPAILGEWVSLVLWHNHPSGDPGPSADDLTITTRVVRCGEDLGVHVLDHVILGRGGGWYSMKEGGEL